LVLLLTLMPHEPSSEPLGPGCLICGRRAVADAILNIGLFVPLGVGLGAVGVALAGALAGGILLSVAIEAAQLWIPGRFASSADVLTNGSGVILGWLLWRSGEALRS